MQEYVGIMAGLAAYGIFRIISMGNKPEFFVPIISPSDLQLFLKDFVVFINHVHRFKRFVFTPTFMEVLLAQ